MELLPAQEASLTGYTSKSIHTDIEDKFDMTNFDIDSKSTKIINRSKGTLGYQASDNSQREIVVFLDGGILFPHNVVIVPGLAGFRIEDIGGHTLDGIDVVVVSRSYEKHLNSDFEMRKQRFSHADVGVLASVSGVTKMQNSQYGLILKGQNAVKIKQITFDGGRPFAKVEKLVPKIEEGFNDYKAAFKALKTLALELFKNSPLGSQESFTLINSTEDPLVLCSLVAPHLTLSLPEKLDLLALDEMGKLIQGVITALVKEAELSNLIAGIQDRVRGEVNVNMKKAFLREQLDALKKELGELDGVKGEITGLLDRLRDSGMPESSGEEIEKELNRMEMMSPGSQEYLVSYNYVNAVLELPWKKDVSKTPEFEEAVKILSADHYGLTKVKERILEHIASLMHVDSAKAQILLLVGPPGVGKTSLVKSIAKSLGKPYQRISLGGVDDVSEIRGHRRTYIGAMPGRIINALRKAGSTGPVVCLDEVDKLGRSHRGDVSAALLEVLDPEQNKTFVDNYISIPVDLSRVVFVATANSFESISGPLVDRMEVLRVSGYDEIEKVEIAKKYLIPELRKDFDLRKSDLNLSKSTLQLIIRHYTRESGVRMLKQRLTSLARKAVCSIVSEEKPLSIQSDNLSIFLGKPLVRSDQHISKLVPGVALGLAYTPYGGDVLHVEAIKSVVKSGSKGVLKLTGQLGDVMKESASAVISYVLSHANSIGISPELVEKSNIHIHFPEGATPKDGPSAGVALLVCLVGLFKGKALPKKLAMTGEITLRGEVLAVGGIKEKVMAAHRLGIDKVMIPASNWFDLDEVPARITEKMTFYPLVKMIDALTVAGLVEQKDDSRSPVPRRYRRTDGPTQIPLRKWQPQRIDQFLDQQMAEQLEES